MHSFVRRQNIKAMGRGKCVGARDEKPYRERQQRFRTLTAGGVLAHPRDFVQGDLPTELADALANASCRRIVLDVNNLQIHRWNLWLLVGLLQKGWRGAIVTVDRPTCIVFNQARRFGASVESLWGIDLVTGVSCPQSPPSARIIVVSSPFLYDFAERLRDVRGRFLEAVPGGPASLHFLMVDNLSALDFYVETSEIPRVVRQIEAELLQAAIPKVILPVDSAARPKVFAAMREWADRVLVLR